MTDDPRASHYREATEKMAARRFPVRVQATGTDEMARLGEALNQLGASLEKSYREADLLLDITQKINAGFLLEEVLDYVYESFRSVIPYDRIGFSLLEDENRILRAFWARSEAPETQLHRGYAARMEGSSLQKILDTGQPRILNDLEQYLELHPDSDATRRIVAEGMRSSLTCPLNVLSKPIGFMFFSSTRPNAYRDVHVDVFLRVSGQLAVIVEKSRLYEDVLRERERAERLLRNILPGPIADRLKTERSRIADGFSDVTILFADLVDFATWSARMSPPELVRLLNEIFLEFDDLTDKYGLEKIKTSGDSYLVAAGLPVPRPDHAEVVAEMALDMLEVMPRYTTPDGKPLQIRIGVHSGPVVAGVIGRKKFAYDVWGDTVNLASRMESHGIPGRIQVSGVTADRLGDQFVLEPLGRIAVKGRGEMETYVLGGRRSDRRREDAVDGGADAGSREGAEDRPPAG